MAIAIELGRYDAEHGVGLLAGGDGMFRVAPGQIRLPDVSLTTWDRLPNDLPNVPTPDLAPDLAVEVLSPCNTVREIDRKRQPSFAGGTRLVWVFDPPTRSVSVHTPGGGSHAVVVLTDADQLDGGDVLPGFAVGVGTIYDRAIRSTRRPTPLDAGRQPPPAP